MALKEEVIVKNNDQEVDESQPRTRMLATALFLVFFVPQSFFTAETRLN